MAFFLGQVWPRLRDARRQTDGRHARRPGELCRDLMKPHAGARLGAAACH
jgi:hypothetical protein